MYFNFLVSLELLRMVEVGERKKPFPKAERVPGSDLPLPQFSTPGTQFSSGELNIDGTVPVCRQVLYTYFLKISSKPNDVSINIPLS